MIEIMALLRSLRDQLRDRNEVVLAQQADEILRLCAAEGDRQDAALESHEYDQRDAEEYRRG